MRLLSNEEKDICKKILQGSGSNNFLGNIIDHKLEGVCIVIQSSTVSLELTQDYFKTPDEMVKKIDEISFFILSTITLIELLEKEGYILTIQRGNIPNSSNKFGGCIGNMPSINYTFPDKNISDLIIKYVNKEIIATVEFQRFCKNGYIPRDEQRFEKQILRTNIALLIAFAALLFNVFFNLSKTTSEVQINQKQIESLISPLKEIKNQLTPQNKKNILDTQKKNKDSIIKNNK